MNLQRQAIHKTFTIIKYQIDHRERLHGVSFCGNTLQTYRLHAHRKPQNTSHDQGNIKKGKNHKEEICVLSAHPVIQLK